MEYSWENEMRRFIEMPLFEKITWLSNLVFLVSMCGRNTYAPGTNYLERPDQLRQYNEIIHKIALFQWNLAQRKGTFSIEEMFLYFHDSLTVNADDQNFILSKISLILINPIYEIH